MGAPRLVDLRPPAGRRGGACLYIYITLNKCKVDTYKKALLIAYRYRQGNPRTAGVRWILPCKVEVKIVRPDLLYSKIYSNLPEKCKL